MNGFSGRVLLLGAVLALLMAGTAIAQDGSVYIYKVGGLKGGTTITAGANVRFLIGYNNTTGEKCDISNGFKISSPDGASWDSTTIDSIGPINNAGTPDDPSDDFSSYYFRRFFDIVFGMDDLSGDGVSPDTMGILAAGTPSSSSRQLPNGFNDSAFAITVWFDGKKTAAGKHLCIDSCFYGTGGTWKWVTKSLIDKFPTWVGLPGQPYSEGNPGDREGSGYCFDIYAPALQLSADSLGFNMQYGGSLPPSQTFTVSSTGDAFSENLAFTLTEFSAWLVKSPSTGTTPRTVTVSMNATGLAPGLYEDSIKVEAAAGNSPLWVKVTFSIQAPPPTIFISKSNFMFSALTGGADPAPQTFYIKNVGGETLNWNLSSASTWLSTSPASGIDSQLVTVSASIAALGAGDYFDTIVVSAPGATNTPIKIPVKLSLGSSLPMIATDSAIYHVIVDIPNTAAPRTVRIYNSGIGNLTFTLSSNSTRIMTYTPSSGTAPQYVTVTFKILNGVDGQLYRDTIWVSSPEAVNSPFPIVFHSMIMDTPPLLRLTKDTIRFTTYGCMDNPALRALTPADTFFAIDSSGADRMYSFKAKILNTSDLCTISPSQEDLPAQFVASAELPPLADGTYYDTILVGVDFAYDSPDTLIVKYTRITTGPNPSLNLSLSGFDVPWQMQTGNAPITINITNGGLGCLPWYIDESIPWFTPEQDSGNVPEVFQGVLGTDDLAFGTHIDSFRVVAPLASNSPRWVHLKVRMWRLRGDCNWDNFINLIDLSWLIAYLVNHGPYPMPEYAVGDTDCSGLIDLQDLSLLIAYLTTHGIICGNPR